ncbi:MAG: hypothetical protein Q8N37_03270 [bacterium]|nr:hypothetical protein [bacterium]
MNKKILIFVAVFFIAIIAVLIIRRIPFKTSDQINNTLSSEWTNSKNDLGKVKAAVLYENITDGLPVGLERNTNEVIKILKETNADMIFRGFWRWYPAFDSPRDIYPELAAFYAEQVKIKPNELSFLVEKSGYNYMELEKRIALIKKENPEIIFVGAIPAQRINRIDKNDITGKIYTTEETWAMALDPGKWNIQKNGKLFTKEEFQAQFAEWHGWGGAGQYDPNKVEAYFPDITNQEYQEILLSWAYRQIDAGANAIWIDGLPQTLFFYPLTNDNKHPMLKDLYNASEKIIDEIHKYGESKGKYIYVGSWGIPLKFIEGIKNIPQNIDFITITPVDNEIFDKKLSEIYEKITNTRNLYGNTPVFAFIDWSTDQSPMVNFSQKLNKKQQSTLLQDLDESFAEVGVNFIYPAHGGYMGPSAKILAFGKYRNYDSLAPEFDTYDMIKELAKKKSGR